MGNCRLLLLLLLTFDGSGHAYHIAPTRPDDATDREALLHPLAHPAEFAWACDPAPAQTLVPPAVAVFASPAAPPISPRGRDVAVPASGFDLVIRFLSIRC